MKRSERISRKAARTAWLSVTILMASVAIGCVAARAVLMSSPIGGWMLLTLALAAFARGADMLADALRLVRLSKTEKRWERDMSIRPRI